MGTPRDQLFYLTCGHGHIGGGDVTGHPRHGVTTELLDGTTQGIGGTYKAQGSASASILPSHGLENLGGGSHGVLPKIGEGGQVHLQPPQQ